MNIVSDGVHLHLFPNKRTPDTTHNIGHSVNINLNIHNNARVTTTHAILNYYYECFVCLFKHINTTADSVNKTKPFNALKAFDRYYKWKAKLCIQYMPTTTKTVFLTFNQFFYVGTNIFSFAGMLLYFRTAQKISMRIRLICLYIEKL